MRFINKQNLYPIFLLSGILILVLFYSGFSFQEGLTGETVPIQVSPATAAIVSSALDNIVQMGFSAVKTTNTMVKQMDAEVKKVEANASTTTPVVPNSTSPQTTWVSTPITSTSQ
jgi:hypothetical protein